MTVATTPAGRAFMAFSGPASTLPELRAKQIPVTGDGIVFGIAFSRVLTDEERNAWREWLSIVYGIVA